MIKLSPRDFKIVIITVSLIILALIWSFLFSPILDKYQEVQESLEGQEKKYNENVTLLKRRSEIQESYKKVEATFPVSDERTPRDAFVEDVADALSQILPGQRKNITPPTVEPIKGVNEYEVLALNLRTSGQLSGLSQLLKGFDQKGFLITQLSISQKGGIDNPELDMDLQLSRIVKIDEETIDKGIGGRRAASGSKGGYR